MTGSMLVAGVGNIFLRDDGFGVEVTRRLATQPVPDGVEVADFGIRGMHLAYELAAGYDELILVDAVARGGEPGTIFVIEPDLAAANAATEAQTMDAHGMDPATVLSLLHRLGGRLECVCVVGCEPADVTEGIGLSAPVEQAVNRGVRTVRELVDQMRGRVGVATGRHREDTEDTEREELEGTGRNR